MSLQQYFMIFSGAGLSGLLVMMWLFKRISSIKVDNEKSNRIAKAIQLGAMAFLNEEYRLIAIAVAFIAIILSYFLSPLAGGVFVVSSIVSMITGLLGMRAATIANVRTTMAAKEQGENAAFLVALFGGGVMGFAVASFGLLGLGILFYLFSDHPDFVILLTSFGLGASFISVNTILFLRINMLCSTTISPILDKDSIRPKCASSNSTCCIFNFSCAAITTASCARIDA